MRTKIVTEAWEFYRDNCHGFKDPMRKQLRKVDSHMAELESENAKLRELVDYMTPIALYGASEQERDRMRELGVEVDG